MQLMDLIQDKYRIVSVVGMAKNAGKTMTMNTLIEEAMERGILLGITSTGRDGEKQDLVTFTEKPMIYVDEGTLIATTEDTLKYGEARLEILEVTDYRTAMGRIVIVQAKTPGYVEVAGPATNREMKEVTERLLSYGAEMVIVDGAIDRMAAASPTVAEAAILATGAVLSRDMGQVMERSLHQIQLFSLPELEDGRARELAGGIMEEKGICTVSERYETRPVAVKTALGSGSEIAAALKEDTRYVVMGGSLVSKTLREIIEGTVHYKHVIFVVKDATRIFIEPRDWMYFMKAGVQIRVMERVRILAVTINPYAPQGYFFQPEEFLNRMRQFLHPIPVFDVVLGGDQECSYRNVYSKT
ncbi:lysine 5,6-aminomutase reactivase subunit KamB [Thermotalea metallivorans]|uniref:Uncharacterized protein n=1 Tax=Thermotalea metallivorans TaxID=520762 RepID=A0A140L6N3_9FIRM|nr:hypothetical protein [Thermotalea metallivorans]KXG76208.1 hypothetical protein AN619_11650 [Thermotalea metallivorans]